MATLSTWWTNDCARFGLEDFTLHELRHTYLVLLAMNSVHPKVMQELAGHYSPQITMDIYAHVEYRRQARGCGGHLEGVLEMHVMTRRTPYLRARLDEINDGSFVVVDYETPYLLAL